MTRTDSKRAEPVPRICGTGIPRPSDTGLQGEIEGVGYDQMPGLSHALKLTNRMARADCKS